MTPPKLSSADKQSVLELYRQPEETTSTLASRYGVSNSTINRVLKQGFSADEYEALVQQKRSAARPQSTSAKPSTPKKRSRSRSSKQATSSAPKQTGAGQPSDGWATPDTAAEDAERAEKQRRRRSSAPSLAGQTAPESTRSSTSASDLPKVAREELPPPKDVAPAKEAPIKLESRPDGKEMPKLKKTSDESDLEAILREDLLDLNEDDLSDLDDNEDDLDGFDEDDEDEDEDEDETASSPSKPIPAKLLLSVQPFADASLPRTCYVVIDRAAELVTKPLKEFGDLGEVPSSETQEKTLPIFDNHRVAKRFSSRFQRVIKVPDGRMLQKTCTYLQDKGITRLLIDGQVYSL